MRPTLSKTESDAANYLAAIIDGEGCVYVPHGYAGTRHINIVNTEFCIIKAAMLACEELGLLYQVRRNVMQPPRKRYLWTMHITGRENLTRLALVVPIRSRRKARALKRLLASYRGYSVGGRIPHGKGKSPERIEEVHLLRASGFGLESIARHYGVTPRTISLWAHAHVSGDPRAGIYDNRVRQDSVRAFLEGR